MKIPKFRGEEEEREFWDTRDVMDFLDELEPTDILFARKTPPKEHGVPPHDADEEHDKAGTSDAREVRSPAREQQLLISDQNIKE